MKPNDPPSRSEPSNSSKSYTFLTYPAGSPEDGWMGPGSWLVEKGASDLGLHVGEGWACVMAGYPGLEQPGSAQGGSLSERCFQPGQNIGIDGVLSPEN